MTQAAEQARVYIETNHPGARISRQSCRDTAGGYISQHSAYQSGDYDSNALDIMGVDGGDWDENVAFIQQVVDDLTPHLKEWSIRKILWQVPAHYGHAHIDFYPMINLARWCSTNGVTPAWKYSDGHLENHLDPAPENGEYHGEDTTMPTTQWHQMIDALFAANGEFQGDPAYWKDMSESSPEWVDFWAAFVRMIDN